MSTPVLKASMHVPPMGEAARVLQEGLAKNFENVTVNVVDCPDLTQEPFLLSAKGICGSPRLADVGGPPYLLPLAQRDKVFNFPLISKLVNLPGAFIVGAGAGPCHVVGVNSELIGNVKVPETDTGTAINNSYIAKTENDACVLEKVNSTDFCLMGNFLCSEGKPGKVIEVVASRRTGPDNFMTSLRTSLADHYNTRPVALGGTFLIESGKANLHIMPDFSKTPLKSDEDVNNWLKFFEMDAPLVCLGELVSHDPDLDLRTEHFHCFSTHGQGGHYHYDTTPNEVKYRAYFSLAEFVYRIDQPKETHKVGR
ncbi:ester hydrolase C11orf54-like [Haliotis cracherodii]|uniref:ester hydrolase C11orf54-like n=1 Tax=Haliotis cracherodii TaxID=6455 RepID=UPI0039E94D4A